MPTRLAMVYELMPTHRTRPIPVDAFRLGDAPPEWWKRDVAMGRADVYMMASEIAYAVLRGSRDVRVEVGDWIVRGPKLDLAVCPAGVFDAMYEAVEPVDDGAAAGMRGPNGWEIRLPPDPANVPARYAAVYGPNGECAKQGVHYPKYAEISIKLNALENPTLTNIEKIIGDGWTRLSCDGGHRHPKKVVVIDINCGEFEVTLCRQCLVEMIADLDADAKTDAA